MGHAKAYHEILISRREGSSWSRRPPTHIVRPPPFCHRRRPNPALVEPPTGQIATLATVADIASSPAVSQIRPS
ncbi:hypothetical protein TIFTF001_047695 [Ficus carica]|uniref:Uncharacterized protein n=1 Tax=Ficus carica TaxID=3494 RepID=A0AA87ZEZ1_FICCA|nr:hypothetical protein TIFTF001_047695 [Ficus carica]